MDAPLLAGRYRLDGLLGRGGMGDVRSGTDEMLGRPVAVKLLRPELAARPDIRTRFTSEARLAARLTTRSVVAVYDVGEHEGQPFIVMERLSGRTFGDLIDAGPVPPAVVRDVALQVLEALAAAHAVGVLHRDIKPTNILDAGAGSWKLGDFGVAKGDEVTDQSLTATGLVVGTAAYLTPERLAGLAAEPSSDLYALGVVLHEALLGTRSRPVGLVAAERVPLDGVPLDLRSVVERATSPDTALRFGSAAAMAEALRAAPTTLAQGVGAAATTVMPAVDRTMVGPAVAPVVAAAPVAGRRPLPAARRAGPVEGPGAGVARGGAALLVLLLLAAVVVAAVLLTRGNGGTSGSTTSTTTPTTAATTLAPSSTTTSSTTTTTVRRTTTTSTTAPTTTTSSTTSAPPTTATTTPTTAATTTSTTLGIASTTVP